MLSMYLISNQKRGFKNIILKKSLGLIRLRTTNLHSSLLMNIYNRFQLFTIMKNAKMNVLVYTTFHILFLRICIFLELKLVYREFLIYIVSILHKGTLFYKLGVENFSITEE